MKLDNNSWKVWKWLTTKVPLWTPDENLICYSGTSVVQDEQYVLAKKMEYVPGFNNNHYTCIRYMFHLSNEQYDYTNEDIPYIPYSVWRLTSLFFFWVSSFREPWLLTQLLGAFLRAKAVSRRRDVSSFWYVCKQTWSGDGALICDIHAYEFGT